MHMNALSLQGEKVLIRVDFNVPMDAHQTITDDTRIRAALPTIQQVLSAGGSVILLSHLGRPQKKRLPDGALDRKTFSLAPVARHLGELLGGTVHFCPELTGPAALAAAGQLQPGEVLLMENTRFSPGEEKGDPELASELARLGNIYINDAFGTAHRAHASTAIIAQSFPPDRRAFGHLMQAELDNAAKVLDHPRRPLLAIVGGAKVSDKILLLEQLLDKVDALIVGGGMAYTFMRARGGQTGQSLVEEDRLDLANQLLAKARDKGIPFLLPADSTLADRFAADALTRQSPSDAIPDGWMGLDIGPEAIRSFEQAIASAQTILWNGPMGVFEMPAFAEGTRAVARAVAAATRNGAFSLVGGGDSVTAINQLGLADQVSFVSTGGGAMLELLEGKTLPGVAAIIGA